MLRPFRSGQGSPILLTGEYPINHVLLCFRSPGIGSHSPCLSLTVTREGLRSVYPPPSEPTFETVMCVMPEKKYTRELLEPAVAASENFWQVAKHMGLTPNGIHNHRMKKLIREFGIPTDHFKRSGKGGRGHQIPPTERLVLNRSEGKREGTDRLRKALIAIGRVEACSECGLTPEWRGRPLTLQIDHVNGDACDNRPENLRFLCPNCHTQTSTWCGGAKRGRKQSP